MIGAFFLEVLFPQLIAVQNLSDLIKQIFGSFCRLDILLLFDLWSDVVVSTLAISLLISCSIFVRILLAGILVS